MFLKFQIGFIIIFNNYLGSMSVNYPQSDYVSCGEGLSNGICKPVQDCPAATRSILLTKQHNLERCGFEGLIEIVCCPENDEVGTPKPVVRAPETSVSKPRKSETACIKYSKEIPPDPTLQILGGENATLGEFPHMAALGYETQDRNEYKWECGGTLISYQFVITAAHCIIKQDGILPTRIRLGIVDLTGSDDVKPLDFTVKNITVHPKYQPRTKLNDLALLELSSKAPNTVYIHPACLYQKNDDPIPLVITGWGHTTQGGDPSSILQRANLGPVTNSECTKFYENRLSRSIEATQLCAVSDDGTKDTCQGDSGGPLQIQDSRSSSIYTLVGITSYGMGCGGKNPGIYTRIASYLNWIESTVWP